MDLELALEVLRRERLPRLEGAELNPRLRAARLAALARLTQSPCAEVLARLLVLLRERPCSALLNLDVGCLADLSGDLALARAHLSRAVELAPRSGVAGALYAELLARVEGDEAAAAFVERALPRDPGEPLLLLMRARLLHRRAGGAAALEAYRAVEERGGARRSIIFYAHAAREAGERALARTLAEVACERHGDDDGLWHLCGELRLSAGEEEGARRALERALALNAAHLHARYTLGLLLRARRPRAAARHLQRAAEHLPEARLELARLLARRGRARAAREELLTLAGLPDTPAEVRAEGRDLLRALGPPPPPRWWERLLGGER